MIPIFEPYFTGNEKKYLKDCIDTSWISSQGEYISKFEKALADYHSMEFAIVTSNCTTALHLSLKALDIKERSFFDSLSSYHQVFDVYSSCYLHSFH